MWQELISDQSAWHLGKGGRPEMAKDFDGLRRRKWLGLSVLPERLRLHRSPSPELMRWEVEFEAESLN